MMQHIRDQADADVVGAFIEQYYSQSTTHPSLVITPVDIATSVSNALQLRIIKAQRGLKRKLVSMGTENAEDYLRREQERWLTEESKAKLGLEELAHALRLDGPPQRIEMYDISHFQSTNVVGSMVVFEHGLPKKSDYRKFTIRDTVIPDDQHRLAEVVRRRFAHHEDDGWPMPDLLMLDGGKGQLSVVIKNVPGLTQHVPVAALAKEHEELYIPGRAAPIRLPAGSQELFLVQRIRDEAHRFAIGFYRQKHRRETTKSLLDNISGLGTKQRRLLLERFGSVEGVRRADISEVANVVGQRLATKIHEQI
jgi:excinuclease ABC subunit C